MSLVNAMRARWDPQAPALAWIGDWTQAVLQVPHAWHYAELAAQVDQARGWIKQRGLGSGETLATSSLENRSLYYCSRFWYGFEL